MALGPKAIRAILRMKTEAHDAEIKGLIEAAKIDLKLAGVEENSGKLYETAVAFFCKANFGWLEPEVAAHWEARYEKLKATMQHSTEYGPIKAEPRG